MMIITKKLSEELARFLLNVPAGRLRQNFIKVFHAYIEHECSDELPDFMPDFLKDFLSLLCLLDAIEKETA